MTAANNYAIKSHLDYIACLNFICLRESLDSALKTFESPTNSFHVGISIWQEVESEF